MNFYEEYSSYAKKEKLYLTGENLSEFNYIVSDLKEKLILKSFNYDYPTDPSFKLDIQDADYPELFSLLNKYVVVTNEIDLVINVLTNQIQNILNDNFKNIGINKTSVESSTDHFKVTAQKQPFNPSDKIIKGLAITIRVTH